MKADLTRRTHQREKHYTRVIHQQGRVPLDADLNEQFDIQHHLGAVEAVDVIGQRGAPKGPSFAVAPSPDGKDLLVHPGTFYVDGILCESEGDFVGATLLSANALELASLTLGGRGLAPGEWVEVASPSQSKVYRLRGVDDATLAVTLGPTDDLSADLGAGPLRLRRRPSYVVQPDWPRPDTTLWPVPVDPTSLTEAELPSIDAATLAPGTYQAYLDVWQRHVTALEDPGIRETALGGPDTCTRARTVWQVKLRSLGAPGTPADCALPASPVRGALRARAKLPGDGSNPCIIAPGSSYRRLENQLYRVEIHGAGTLTGGAPSAGMSFKFSRDNGSVAVRWLAGTATDLTVESTGPDSALGLAAEQWIELLDDERDLAGTPGTLVQIDTVTGHAITMAPGTATGTTSFADFRGNPRLRRWDQEAATLEVKRDATVNDGWLELEDGVQVLFEDGAYQTGDYWLIPARTITADVEWPLDLDGQPLARPPEGIHHHLAPLASLAWDGTAWTPLADADCRAQFPPLTHISAEDVFVEGDPCGLGAKNVQEAIEALCAQQDLPFHNQHLHGWGVVCGLPVKCLPIMSDIEQPREKVLIEPGYAIHPTGVDMKLDQQIVYPIVAEAQSLIPEGGTLDDIAVSLWMDADLSLHLDPYDPDRKTTARELLDGTILVDFYDHCLKPVVEFWKKEISPDPEEGGELVDPARKRVTTLLNLLWQQMDGQNGPYIYLSGERDPAKEGPNSEDRILRNLWSGLRKLLQSETFCAMFDDVTFPEYDVFVSPEAEATTVPHPRTIFGKGDHTRLRLHPDGRWAVTCHSVAHSPHVPLIGNTALKPAPSVIHVYDLEAHKLVAEVEFPVTPARVQDVAFNPGTNEIYAVAWIGTAMADSAVVSGTIGEDGNVTWSTNQITCSKKLVTLASGREPAGKLYAAARGEGVFVFEMKDLVSEPPRVGTETHATGHLVLVPRGNGAGAILYAGYHSTVANPAHYDHVVGIDLGANGEPSQEERVFTLTATETLRNTGHDDLCGIYDASTATGAPVNQLFVIAEGKEGGSKALITFNGNTAEQVRVVSLEESTTHRLAYNRSTNQLFVTYEDSYHGRQYSVFGSPPELRENLHPLQIGAVSVQASPDGHRWYVLNWLSNTITAIPAHYPGTKLAPWESVIDVNKLAAYRQQVLLAFLKMFGRFLQYLKDCFCELLLVRCPDPAGKKVYLADVSFKDGSVYQICNFSRRKYVHTFPTVEYWLSVIPAVPVVKKLVELFCCSTLTGLFDGRRAPSREASSGLRVSQVRSGAQWTSEANLPQLLTTQKAQFMMAGAFAKTSLGELFSQPPPAAPAGESVLTGTEIIGRQAEVVTRLAISKGVGVARVTQADWFTGATTLLGTALRPATITRGTYVELITDSSQRVLGYRSLGIPHANVRVGGDKAAGMAPTPLSGAVAPATDVAALSAEVTALRRELEALKARLR